LYEIHLIDSPAFDNGSLLDTKILSDIANSVSTAHPEGEEEREKTLMNEDKYFGTMLKSAHQATTMRFDPKS
jgi:hypothetical protein